MLSMLGVRLTKKVNGVAICLRCLAAFYKTKPWGLYSLHR